MTTIKTAAEATPASAQRMTWAAGWNMPGYMPDSEPATFDTWEDARAYLREELTRLQEDTEQGAAALCVADTIERLDAAEPGMDWGETVEGWHHWIDGTPRPFTDDELYNCQPNAEAPDWTQYDALEIGGCIDISDPETRDEEGTQIQGGEPRESAEFFTVYAHLKTGGADALTDCDTLAEAEQIAAHLASLTGFPVHITC